MSFRCKETRVQLRQWNFIQSTRDTILHIDKRSRLQGLELKQDVLGSSLDRVKPTVPGEAQIADEYCTI